MGGRTDADIGDTVRLSCSLAGTDMDVRYRRYGATETGRLRGGVGMGGLAGCILMQISAMHGVAIVLLRSAVKRTEAVQMFCYRSNHARYHA